MTAAILRLLVPIFSASLMVAIWPLSVVSQTNSDEKLRGVNLAEGASGSYNTKSGPGRYGYVYKYPDAETSKPFIEAGMNTVRLPFRWERVQPTAFGELSPTEMERLDASIDAMSGFSTVILDVHNYAHYFGEPLDVEQGGPMLADLWHRLAARYANNPSIAFGVMNEPFGIDARSWRAIMDKVIVSIRDTGARNLVLVPGTRWSGGHSWMRGGDGGNGSALAGFADPADNFIYEVHQYLDADSSGTSTECVSPEVAQRRLHEVTAWLRKEGRQALLGEFGAAPNEGCLEALSAMLDYIENSDDAWKGWAYWAGGSWWGDYPFSIQPKDGQHRPQMLVLRRYLQEPDVGQ